MVQTRNIAAHPRNTNTNRGKSAIEWWNNRSTCSTYITVWNKERRSCIGVECLGFLCLLCSTKRTQIFWLIEKQQQGLAGKIAPQYNWLRFFYVLTLRWKKFWVNALQNKKKICTVIKGRMHLGTVYLRICTLILYSKFHVCFVLQKPNLLLTLWLNTYISHKASLSVAFMQLGKLLRLDNTICNCM